MNLSVEHTWLSGLDDGAATSCHCATCWLHHQDSVGHSSRWWEGKSLVAPDFKGTAVPAELWNRLSGNDQLSASPVVKSVVTRGCQSERQLQGNKQHCVAVTSPSRHHTHTGLSQGSRHTAGGKGVERSWISFSLHIHSWLSLFSVFLTVSNGERCTINACADYPTTRQRADCHFLSPCYHYAVSWTGSGQSQGL